MSLHQKLHALFLLDQQVRGLRSRLDSAQARLQQTQVKLTQCQQQREELRQQHKLVQTKAAALELQTKEIDVKIARYRDQMNTVKTNKEYSTLLVEANTLKQSKGTIEEQALAELTKADELAGKITEFDAAILEQEKICALAKNDVEQCRAEIGQRLDALTQERHAAAEQVPAEARAIFDKQAAVHDGEAMAQVVEENRRAKEYSCGGCYISLPIQRVSALLSGVDEVICCPSCGRILFLDNDLKASMAPRR